MHRRSIFGIYEVAVALQSEIAIFPAEHVALAFLEEKPAVEHADGARIRRGGGQIEGQALIRHNRTLATIIAGC